MHLSSETVQTLHLFSEAPVFGTRAVNKDVQQAATTYHARLTELFELMEVLLFNGTVMARAAHQIAGSYESADSLSVDEVNVAVGTARTAAAADGDAIDPETGRPI